MICLKKIKEKIINDYTGLWLAHDALMIFLLSTKTKDVLIFGEFFPFINYHVNDFNLIEIFYLLFINNHNN